MPVKHMGENIPALGESVLAECVFILIIVIYFCSYMVVLGQSKNM
jgi:hypothetical protein